MSYIEFEVPLYDESFIESVQKSAIDFMKQFPHTVKTTASEFHRQVSSLIFRAAMQTALTQAIESILYSGKYGMKKEDYEPGGIILLNNARVSEQRDEVINELMGILGNMGNKDKERLTWWESYLKCAKKNKPAMVFGCKFKSTSSLLIEWTQSRIVQI